jgi:hypothetical protein
MSCLGAASGSPIRGIRLIPCRQSLSGKGLLSIARVEAGHSQVQRIFMQKSMRAAISIEITRI